MIKKNIQDLIVNEKLVVATNSLPMFLVVQMFFPSETVGKEDNTEITKRIFTFIKAQIAKVKRSYTGQYLKDVLKKSATVASIAPKREKPTKKKTVKKKAAKKKAATTKKKTARRASPRRRQTAAE